MEYFQLYEDILKNLVEKDIYFAPRKTNRDNRLAEGRWFIGTNDYMCVSFWNGYDHNRKVPNIHLQIHHGNTDRIQLVATSRNDESKLDIIQEVVQQLGLVKDTSINHWHKDYPLDGVDHKSIIRKINEFVNADKLIIDNIVTSKNHITLNHIKGYEYEKWIDHIRNFESTSYIPVFKSHTKIKARKVSRRGVSELRNVNYIREQLPKKALVKKRHIQLQNKLKELLLESLEKDATRVIFEENFIDLTVEYEDRIELYEVKTYDTAMKNIQAGIGQLLQYYYQNYKNCQKPVQLFIAGPCKARPEDNQYLDFLNSEVNLCLGYLKI